MDLDSAIETIERWLTCVHTETARSRVDEKQAEYRSKPSALREQPGVASDAELFRTSRHEGAHACVAHVMGLPVAYAELNRDASGAVDYKPADESVTAAIAVAIADLAGIAAELLAGDVHPWRMQSLAHSSDTLLARLHIDHCRALAPSPDWNMSTRFFAAASCCAVLSNADAISRVGNALLADGSLPGSRIRALCAGGPTTVVAQ